MKIDYETIVVCRMIRLYCRKKEGNKELCPECRELTEYAVTRLRHCPFGDAKGSCRQCKIHCYRHDMKVKIQQVMRFSGPRMILFHPIMAIRHLIGK